MHAVHDTLLTFNGGNFKTVVPDLATSYQVLDGASKFVFTSTRRPSSPMAPRSPRPTSVWSLNRLINLKGNPSFLLAGPPGPLERVTADGPETVVMTSS